MTLDKNHWVKMLRCVAERLHENKLYLSEIDSKFGDGDHGVTMNKIADVIESTCDLWLSNDWTIAGYFVELGDRITNISGGSAGPLYGTFFSGLALEEENQSVCDASYIKRMLNHGLEELQTITNAKVGDKTMMDTLIPAITAATSSPDDIKILLHNARDAAIEGAKASEHFISRFGRAKSYKEATIGTPDAGAVSCSYIFIGLYEGLLS